MLTRKTILSTALFVLLGASALSASAQTTLKPWHQPVMKDCATCHTKENAVAGNPFVVPDDKTCMSCHGSYKDIAKKTEGGDEPNPHASHHYGEGLSCTACHKEHQPSKILCNDCHDFRIKPLR